MWESGLTLSAHRLHICPNQGLFCARFAQPAFLCIKSHLSGQGPSILLAQDRSVTQKPHWGFCCFANVNLLCKQNSRQFSAFVCVHQPDGFKDLPTGDFCCRRLFVLPGLGCCRGQVLGVEVCFDLLGQLQPGADCGTRSAQTPGVPLSKGGTTLSAAPVQWASRPGAGTAAHRQTSNSL